MADEVATLIRRGILDARSTAGDALIDYRNPEPPYTERSDRIADLQSDLAEARGVIECAYREGWEDAIRDVDTYNHANGMIERSWKQSEAAAVLAKMKGEGR